MGADKLDPSQSNSNQPALGTTMQIASIGVPRASFRPDLFWEQALLELEKNIPKSQFETWVRCTKVDSSVTNELRLVSANAHARDWLKQNIHALLQSLLSSQGFPDVVIKFTVEGREEDPTTSDEDEPIELQEEYADVYGSIVQPDKVIVLPAYFFRHIRRLGPYLSWLYIGFRQASFFSGFKSGWSKTIAVPAGLVCRFSGRSNTSMFSQVVGREETWKTLQGFVQKLDQKRRFLRHDDGTITQQPNSYKISMDIPLTPADGNSLLIWIRKNMDSGTSIIDAVEKAINTPLEELIPWEQNLTPSADAHPITVVDLIGNLGGNNARSRALQEHLMPNKDIILIRYFFVEHCVPKIGYGPAWLVTWLRDKCYQAVDNKESNNRNTCAASHQEMADLLGIKREKTIREWLDQGQLGRFISRSGSNGRGPKVKQSYFVSLNEPQDLVDTAIAAIKDKIGRKNNPGEL